MWQNYLDGILQGDVKSLARAISLVENEAPGYETLLQLLPPSSTPIIGITGPPGAGKSTLTDALIEQLTSTGKRVGIICIDPSSPFHLGALLGDRIRMSEWYNHPNVFIRSLATRGALGGLHPHIIEITDLMRSAPFDYLVVETVGVGQSEIEIAGLADVTVVVLVPEAGDEVQTMKAGLMEIADVFVVNKSDRPDADLFVRNLHQMLAPAFSQQAFEIPIIKTVAAEKKGINELLAAIQQHIQPTEKRKNLQLQLLTDKAWHLLQQERMKGFNKSELKNALGEADGPFNLYTFIQKYKHGNRIDPE